MVNRSLISFAQSCLVQCTHKELAFQRMKAVQFLLREGPMEDGYSLTLG